MWSGGSGTSTSPCWSTARRTRSGRSWGWWGFSRRRGLDDRPVDADVRTPKVLPRSTLRFPTAADIVHAMNPPLTTYVHLAPNPKSAYKQLFVKGTRIRARVLYGWYACEEPMTPDEI